jgi:hypothetical protein
MRPSRSRWIFAALAVALVAIPAGRMAEGQGPRDWSIVIKPPSADTYVSSFVYEVGKEKVYPGPYGSSEGLFVGNAYDRAFKIYGHGRAYLRFDMAAVPEGAEVLRAELRLFLYQAPKRELKYLAFRVLGPWDYRTMKWADQPPVAESPTAWALVGAEPFVWVSWDITQDAKLWLRDPRSNFGTALRIEEERDADGEIAAFDSKEGVHSVGGERAVPRLEIAYSGPRVPGAIPLATASTATTSEAGKPTGIQSATATSTNRIGHQSSSAIWTRSTAAGGGAGDSGPLPIAAAAAAGALAAAAISLALRARGVSKRRSAKGRAGPY